MRIPIFQIDAFATRPFAGNPAAVCLLESWPEDSLLQSIAMENNLSETAYLVPRGDDFELRWFTPKVEVELCGHATLASAHVVLRVLEPNREQVTFHSRKRGALTVRRAGERLELDFPATSVERLATIPPELSACIDQPIREAWKGRDFIAVLADEAAVRAVKPDLTKVIKLPGHGVRVTAPGDAHDFVSRYFAPQVGIDEDPVTGAAHCELAPLWSQKLGKTELRAFQCSARGGEVLCRVDGPRVFLQGHTVLFLRGALEL